MPYRDLYEFAQTVDAYQGEKQYVSRNKLRDKAVEIAGIEKVSHARTGMDLGVTRGLWLTPTNSDHHFTRQFGGHVILTKRGLNTCWERMVYVKELMHLFDEEDGRASTGEEFDYLLGEFASQGEVERSPQWDSETIAVWRALAVLCPEEARQAFAKERNAVTIDDYEIALRLKLPQFHVPKLFSPTFERMLEIIK